MCVASKRSERATRAERGVRGPARARVRGSGGRSPPVRTDASAGHEIRRDFGRRRCRDLQGRSPRPLGRGLRRSSRRRRFRHVGRDRRAPSGVRAGAYREYQAQRRPPLIRSRGGIAPLSREPSPTQTALLTTILGECDELRSVLHSVAVLRELTPRGADRVAAAGELMSSRIVAAALTSAGTPARWIDPRRVLITDDGRPVPLPLLDATRAAAARELQPVVEAGEVAVTGGFVGATAAGITTTLGRGGSDLSASVLGAALNAREIQIWTDVDGMLTADPRVVDGARGGTAPVVRGSVRARILRRQGAASKHHSSRRRRRDTRPDPQYASPRWSPAA